MSGLTHELMRSILQNAWQGGETVVESKYPPHRSGRTWYVSSEQAKALVGGRVMSCVAPDRRGNKLSLTQFGSQMCARWADEAAVKPK